MALLPGDLRHRIKFTKKIEASGVYGKEIEWLAIKSVRAKVTQPITDESDSEQGSCRKVKLIIFIFFTPNISEDNRLIYNGVEYDITSCRDATGKRRELIINAEKRS